MSADPNPIPLYAQLDLWMALGGDAGEFDAWREERSFADAWAELLAAARTLRTRTPDWTAPASGMPRPPAEEPRSRPEPVRGSTAKGTGVSEPDRRSEAVHWLKFDKETRKITGCQCGFAADMDSDCGWGDSVVAHLFEVAAARPVHTRQNAASLRAIAERRLERSTDALATARAEGIAEAARLLERGLEDLDDDTAAALDRAHNHGQRST